MYKPDRVQKYDVLLYRPKNGDNIATGISFFNNLGRWGRQQGYMHSALYLGQGRIIHSAMSVNPKHHIAGAKKSGVHISKIPKSEYKLIDIYRLPGILTSYQENRLYKWFEGQLFKPYDAGSFGASFVRSTIFGLFGFDWFSSGQPVFNDRDAYNCSELTALGFKKALNINLVPGIHPLNVTPADLGSKRSLLKKIC